ncbi:MAG: PQQ-like beta-propeller repeat protein, partial [Deltaproteobacteria bacterium]|nr:PQQ-like beta-propeller repeat protein [Deltaproteobacteria bacterium]
MRASALTLLALAACSQPVDLVFKRRLPGPSVSTPLVTQEFIAVGHEVGVTILDLDGRERCTFSTHREVISAPKTDDKLIFFGSTNYIAYAIDTQCKEVWKFPTADRIKSDPLLAGGVLYVSSYDGHLYAVQAKSGQRLWSFPSQSEPPRAAPVEAAAKGKRKSAGPVAPPPIT